MKRAIIMAALTLQALSDVIACTCDELPPVAGEVVRSDAVFTGQVTQLTLESRVEDRVRRDLVVCRFTVRERFKGISEEREDVVVVTNYHATTCGYPFRLGEAYLVYANIYQGELRTSICQRTRPLLVVRAKPGRDPRDVADLIRDDTGDREAAQVRALMKTQPNKAPEPTPSAVTPRATERAPK